MSKDIKKSLERSSFGTKKAAAARRSVTVTAASKVVARAATHGKATGNSRPKSGG